MAGVSEFVQVGFTACRTPGGGWKESVELFVKAEDTGKIEAETLTEDIGALLGSKMKAYMDECRKEGVAV